MLTWYLSTWEADIGDCKSEASLYHKVKAWQQISKDTNKNLQNTLATYDCYGTFGQHKTVRNKILKILSSLCSLDFVACPVTSKYKLGRYKLGIIPMITMS